MIEQQVRHMTHLVDDLLDVSRITRGKIQLRSEPMDLNDSIRLAVESVRSSVERRRFDIRADQPDEPLPVKVDPTRIEQVLVNLLNNALKYSDPATPVRLTARREGEDVVVRIRDQGIGIDPEMLPRVFDLFSQADGSLDRSQGGLGIGLTLVKTLVEMHGGHVEALSEGLGRGSEFVVRLPVCLEALASHADLPADSPGEPRPLRVLVVDDNQHSAESLALLLNRWNHEARVAYDGPSALIEAEEFRPDAILLDLGLPRMDGFQVARLLRQQKAFQTVIIIAMTGYGHDDDRRRTRESGFNHHLVKPVDLASLKRLLETLAVSDQDRASGEA